LCTPGKTSRSVIHPEIAAGPARLTPEFFASGLPKKKVYLGGMSILSILLSFESGCHKSSFLNDVIKEEVYVRQPPGFENPKYPNRVCKLSKALYELKQVLWAWSARLKTFSVDHGYVMGSVDKTLFTPKYGNDFLLDQIYVDGIIFGGSSHLFVSCF
jgi:hypothetical protein